jgi:DNA modification methylase
MYFYPDNVQESILIFQNGEFNYKSIPQDVKEGSKIDLKEYQKGKWYLSTWNIVNVLPLKSRLENGIAAFPDEIPYRLINLFSYVGETVLDPFAGSGTTNKVAATLRRNSVGYEIDLELREILEEKMGLRQGYLFEKDYEIEMVVRSDAKHLRTRLQKKVSSQKSVVRNGEGNAKRSTR